MPTDRPYYVIDADVARLVNRHEFPQLATSEPLSVEMQSRTDRLLLDLRANADAHRRMIEGFKARRRALVSEIRQVEGGLEGPQYFDLPLVFNPGSKSWHTFRVVVSIVKGFPSPDDSSARIKRLIGCSQQGDHCPFLYRDFEMGTSDIRAVRAAIDARESSLRGLQFENVRLDHAIRTTEATLSETERSLRDPVFIAGFPRQAVSGIATAARFK